MIDLNIVNFILNPDKTKIPAFKKDFRSWDREDDFADYNDNEADDYRDE